VTVFRQLLIGASQGDAITQMALQIQPSLARIGPSEVYARFVDPSASDAVTGINELPPGEENDVLLYHASYGDPEVTQVLRRRPERLVLLYHNITPSKYFIDDDPVFAAGLEWGRHELSLLREQTSINVADSEFNAAELRSCGFAEVHVIPAGLQPARLVTKVSCTATTNELSHRVPVPFVLSVGQLLPHKRHDVVIQAVHLLQWCHGLDVGLVLVGPSRSAAYERALRELVRRLNVSNVWFAGRRSDQQLATIFRAAAVYAGASEHEGLGIPPLEAMAFGVPVIVRDAGATADTVRGGALVLPDDSGPMMFAEAIRAVLGDQHLRTTLASRGHDRIAELQGGPGIDDLVELIVTRLGA
jgi:glycosyltransferase involved in cell wall biosynthesis